jgi:uracil-DNA glycosylase family 4
MIPLIGPISDFTLGESLLSPEDIAKHAKQLGYTAVALTDDHLTSMTRFAKACKKHEIRPIFGARLTIFDEPTDKTPPKQREKPNRSFKVKVFPKNEEGIQHLYRLISLANDKEHFYYVPRLGYTELVDALASKNLCIASGDIFTHEQGARLWTGIRRATGASSAFHELFAVPTPYYTRLNQDAIQANDGDSPYLLSRPMLYAESEQADTLDILRNVLGNTTINAPWRKIPFSRDLSMIGPQDLMTHVKATQELLSKRMDVPADLWKQALLGTNELAKQAQWQWHKRDITLPTLVQDEIGELNRLIADGWKKRLFSPVLGYQPTDLQPYKDRLVHELGIIKQMGFVRYFLMVADLVTWAKAKSIPVGPGRGSASGALLSYLLGITDVDPIRFNLMFERFINPDRLDLPDIDLDFATSKRQQVLPYFVEKYGEDRVSGVMNFGTMASSSALRDVCRVYELSPFEYECSKLVPKDSGKPFELNKAADEVPDLDAFRKKHPHIWEHAVRLQGRMRSYGTHAAGVCVGGESLIHRAPIMSRQEGLPMICMDKREIEDAGLIKLDCLGLSTLDLLDLACQSIKKRTGEEIDLLDVTLCDEKVMDAFGEGRTNAVFQYESGGMKTLLRDLASSGRLSFNDLVAASALYRPGPMQSGLMDQYVRAKQTGQVYYDHPKLESVLVSTLGVITFQEQVSNTAKVLAGFSAADADHVRKSMGKKDPTEMAKWRDRFVEGCVSHSGMTEMHAGQLFDKIEKFAGYAFNLSHSCNYATISYQCMHLKVYYPADFFAAALSILDSDRWSDLIKEAEDQGVQVLPTDINDSGFYFEVNADGNIVAPLTAVKGISEKIGQAILEGREKAGGRFNTFMDLTKHTDLKRCHKGIQEALDKVGAFVNLDFSEPAMTKTIEKHYPHISVVQSALTDPSRQVDQLSLLPGLGRVSSVQRLMSHDAQIKQSIVDNICSKLDGCQACSLAGQPHVPPRFGKTAKAMVVFDCPSYGEESRGEMIEGLGSEYVRDALRAAGLDVGQFYWTTLVKSRKPKKGKLSNEQINACSKYLDQEIQELQPGLIIGLGSTTLKHLVKGSKFSQADAGRVEFVGSLNAAVLVGINPAGIYMNPGHQETLNNIFKHAKELLESQT